MSKIRVPGLFVQHKETGKKGRTFDNRPAINSKIPVYYDLNQPPHRQTAVLCSQDKLTVLGYID